VDSPLEKWLAAPFLTRSEELDQRRGLNSELDEMWAYVARKSNPRWLWHAIDHHSGHVLAYVFGRRQDDETYIKVKGQWRYLYRAVDKQGQTMDFLLTQERDEQAATLADQGDPSPRRARKDHHRWERGQ
jgi:transposase-like protein